MNKHCKYIPGIALLVILAPLPQLAGAAGEADILYWVAPMDPNYRRDKPGKSPMGMDPIPGAMEMPPSASSCASAYTGISSMPIGDLPGLSRR